MDGSLGFDPNAVKLPGGSFTDYTLPRADDLVAFDIALVDRPTAVNPFGVKGWGQVGCIATPQTVMAALLDALRPADVQAIDRPASPEHAWRALRSASTQETPSSKRALHRLQAGRRALEDEGIEEDALGQQRAFDRAELRFHGHLLP